MKKIIPILALCAFLFPSYPAYANHVSYHKEGIDYCDNLEGEQSTMPEGYSSVGSPGQCYIPQDPTTIDIVAPGEAPETIDIVPTDEQGNSGPAQQIDVNPGIIGSDAGLTPMITASSTASDGTEVATSTPAVKTTITSIEELQTYIFDPAISPEVKQQTINERIKEILQIIIDHLIAQIEAILEANETATSTPEVL